MTEVIFEDHNSESTNPPRSAWPLAALLMYYLFFAAFSIYKQSTEDLR